MKAGLSAAYSVFIIVLTTASVITLLYFFVTSTSLPTVLEWLAVIGIIIVIYVVGIVVSFAGLYAIEKLFERDKNRAVRRQGK
jgi:ABC-type antimicrobial peptide transport system permease subunit